MKVPTAREIDALISEFAGLQKIALEAGIAAKARTAESDAVKVRLVAMVEQFGAQHTPKSKRLKGNHNTATTTTGTLTSVDEAGVELLKKYLDKAEIDGLRERFFTERVSYQLVDAPGEVLKTLSLPGKIRSKVTSLVALCFSVSTKAPSLKIDVVEPAKAA